MLSLDFVNIDAISCSFDEFFDSFISSLFSSYWESSLFGDTWMLLSIFRGGGALSMFEVIFTMYLDSKKRKLKLKFYVVNRLFRIIMREGLLTTS